MIDPANLAQNVLQVFEAIEEGLRTLEQIELAVRATTGIDFGLTAQLEGQLNRVSATLNTGASILFEQTESLEQFRDEFPEVFEQIDTLENIVGIIQGQNRRILGASEQAIQGQSVSAEEIENVQANVRDALAESGLAQGQTAAIQAGNELQGQIIAMLVQIQSTQLTAQRLQALQAGAEASEKEAAQEFRNRFHDQDFEEQNPGYTPSGWTIQ